MGKVIISVAAVAKGQELLNICSFSVIMQSSFARLPQLAGMVYRITDIAFGISRVA